MLRYQQNQIMILGTLNAVLVVKMTPEGGEIHTRVIYMQSQSLSNLTILDKSEHFCQLCRTTALRSYYK